MSRLLTFGLGGPAGGLLTFGLGAHAAGGPVVVDDPIRDDLVLEAAGSVLLALGVFNAVHVGSTPAQAPAPASDEYAVAWLWIEETGDERHSTVGVPLVEHEGMAGVAFEIRHPDGLARMRRAERVKAILRNALEYRSLAGSRKQRSKLSKFATDDGGGDALVRAATTLRWTYPLPSPTANLEDNRESGW
jgi:hypothetical protein